MGKHKGWYGFFLTVFLVPAGVFSVQAADGGGDAYTYTVTFLPGDKGVFDLEKIRVSVERNGAAVESADVAASEERIAVSGLEYGDRVSVTPDVKTEESMYYVRGIRRAGYDNNDAGAMLASSVVVHDMEYVVAYGVPGEMVHYTVRYEDADGNPLLEERVYRGKVGDTPVAGYLYIPGYEPRAYNLTKTLVEDERENIFTFVYAALPSGGAGGGSVTTVTTTETVTVPGQEPVQGGAAGTVNEGVPGAGAGDAGAVDDGTAEAAADGAAGAADDSAEEAGDTGGQTGEQEEETAPEELVNLDDEETPLAGGSMNGGLQPAGYMAVFTGLAGAAVLAAGFICFYIRRKKRQRAGEEDTDES